MPLAILPIYAAICGILLVMLSLRVVRLRGKYKVGIGDGGQAELSRAIRVQANFIEYVPTALILLLLLELAGAPTQLLHGLGIALVLSRIAHAIGYSKSARSSAGRAVGAVGTFLVLLVAAVWLIYLSVNGVG